MNNDRYSGVYEVADCKFQVKIENGGSNRADQYFKSSRIQIRNGIWGLRG